MNTLSKLAVFGTTLSLLACSGTTHEPNAAASACANLPNAKAEAAALYQPGVMYTAAPVKEKIFKARAIQPTKTVGADVYVRADKGMTEAYVERVLSCHAASGTPAHPNDMLYPSEGKITELSVRSAGNSLAIRVVGDSPSTGREIFERAKAISSGGGSVSVEQMARADAPTATF